MSIRILTQWNAIATQLVGGLLYGTERNGSYACIIIIIIYNTSVMYYINISSNVMYKYNTSIMFF